MFLVVCIYAPFLEMIEQYFTSLTRVAMPFFMIAGFYYSNVVQQRNCKGA